MKLSLFPGPSCSIRTRTRTRTETLSSIWYGRKWGRNNETTAPNIDCRNFLLKITIEIYSGEQHCTSNTTRRGAWRESYTSESVKRSRTGKNVVECGIRGFALKSDMAYQGRRHRNFRHCPRQWSVWEGPKSVIQRIQCGSERNTWCSPNWLHQACFPTGNNLLCSLPSSKYCSISWGGQPRQ